ncbi:MAG TPA: nitronate monooxygenase family protein [Candidatus Binatia bacterium]|nr:nitronate monooxygenase family protein [Candidatus Binatia bacterium]
MKTRVSEMFGIQFPVFAFSHCRDVVAAVSRAGGLGVLGALAFSNDQLEIELDWIDEHVGGKPYGVDIVMPNSLAAGEMAALDKTAFEAMIPERHRAYVEEVLDRHRVPHLPADAPRHESLLAWTHGGARSQVDIALSHPIKLLVNALGTPPKDVIDKVHARGVQVAALCGSVEHARRHVEAGIDIIVAQGSEAGGHTGDIGTMVLIPDVVDAVAPRPVLAAGGIASGRQIAAALALGAEGAWMGSVWLTTSESDLHPVAVQKLLHASARDTVRSRSMTGKPARQLRTDWTEAWDGPSSPGTLPMPLQFMLTSEAIQRIHSFAHLETSGAKELIGSPVGQVVGRMTSVRPVKEVVYDMMNEFVDAVNRVSTLLED